MTNSTGWRKSSYSTGGSCVEVGGWRTSTRSGGGECVEVGHGPAVIGVRDSKLAESPMLTFPAATWERFTAALKAA